MGSLLGAQAEAEREPLEELVLLAHEGFGFRRRADRGHAAQLLIAIEPARVARELRERIGPALHYFLRQLRRARQG